MQKAIIFLIIVLASNFVGMYFGFDNFWWFDVSLHFLGGFFVAMLMVHYLTDIKGLRITDYELRPLKKYLIIIGAVSFIGVIWEFAEYDATQTLTELLYDNFGFRIYFIGDLNDTIKDLFMDILGAFAWLIINDK